ncbi:hypothetical protein FQN54_002127 [Arachnomyces sp. PD_36]|nr:hypothetical protein FQN54_002127 [Arachnomyces sp. PD_36]
MGEPPISAETDISSVSKHHVEPVTENGSSIGVDSENQYQNALEPDTTISPRQSSDSLRSNHSGDGARKPSIPNGSYGFPDPSEQKVSWKSKLPIFWQQNKGVFLVLLAQLFAAFMNVMTRLLERNGPHGEGMHTFQILFARMSITVLCSMIYMWYTKTPNPFGIPSVRILLIVRGTSGFFGVSGLYYSLQYLPLSEATVLTFMAPIVACYACSFLMPNEPFTRRQQLAAIVSLFGVVLIARPSFLFPNRSESGPDDTPGDGGNSTSPGDSQEDDPNHVSPEQRLLAILAGLFGVLGAGIAYTTIRWIGKRAHPLVSVTYFSALTTIISLIALVAVPSVPFRLPGNAMEWILLFGLGSCGFLLQFLLTAGLAYVPPPLPTKYAPNGRPMTPAPSSGHGTRATSMVYSQMIFALIFDKLIWNSTPSPLSWTGSAFILASTIYIALAKDGGKKKPVSKEEREVEGERRRWREEGTAEEGRGLLDSGVESPNYEATSSR